MASRYSPDPDQTPRTLLRRVLDTADSRTPRRRRSVQTNAQRTLLQTPSSSKRQGRQTKTIDRRHSLVTRSVVRLAGVQAHGHLEEQTPRTLLKNILLTAPESSIVMPVSVVKPVQVPEMVESSRRESSPGSLELQLPDLERPSTLAPRLPATGRSKQRLRLSVFEQEVNQGLPLSQEPPGNADASSLASSFNLSFVPPRQLQSVGRPGLARRRPIRRPVDVGVLLQDLEDNSLTSALPGDNYRTPVATLPMDAVLEDTQPFSQPSVGCSLRAHHSLPSPSHSEVEGVERGVGRRTRSTETGLEKHMSRTSCGTPPLPFSELQPQPPEIKEAVGSQEAVEAKEQEGSSGHEDTPGRPGLVQASATSPKLASGTYDLLQAEQPHQSLQPSIPLGVAVSEPPESVPTRIPARTRTVGPRHHHDPYKAGLGHYMKLFSFYTKMPVEKKALEMVEKCLDKYFQHLCNDLEAFSAHAGRKTVKLEDLELLLRRQRLVTDQVSLHVLVERYLPLEYRQLLIPCASSGNSVFPAQ
ncbi:centromere protein T [Phodopus roborovskii]|uniref:Centromere protein T n=1 Tax=Phodopus roborovskii TaxID=109678 RepID=A0AAU9ZZ46_PHORO|nr:centromere protein T [Phodopus roborovskii]CAH7067993.1 Cenpt [Phodopus roborovskii]